MYALSHTHTQTHTHTHTHTHLRGTHALRERTRCIGVAHARPALAAAVSKDYIRVKRANVMRRTIPSRSSALSSSSSSASVVGRLNAFRRLKAYPAPFDSLHFRLFELELPTAPAAATASACIRPRTSAYVSIRQHTSAYVRIRQHSSAFVSIRQHAAATASACTCHTSAYFRMRHESAYVSMRLPRPAPAIPFCSDQPEGAPERWPRRQMLLS